ncbi:hypothetical protein ST201phi2-1p362 [Pseudomonas phage 201phi2-1]|uniref:Uncharacterized protein n=1 Tax=Pseudomonas phage 201phi2-1 TaxID=198110 RepID=B3FJM2_BP201|nr:hypothetical protein ST201phi2-1p362 [Pseudomonas phage 201phi2-1]ABY63187.1 hypothetical protein 201phi2-1p362 [Pseudomonas phage 201phi2-1]
MEAKVGTKLQPQGVFSIVGLLPKELQERFRKECWTEEKQEETDFVPDPVLKYDHVLGLSWLTAEGIPNTQEELDAQREMIFKTMISGPTTYNVGQFFVLFPNVVYTTRDIEDSLMIVEVLDELEFPATDNLVTPALPEYNQYGYMSREALAIRAALHSYVASGRIKIHEGAMRMYACEEQYKFEERYKKPDEKPLTFVEMARRRRG